MSNNIYVTPLTGRYSGLEMQKLFSLCNRYSTLAALALARGVSEVLGLDISDEAISQTLPDAKVCSTQARLSQPSILH